MAESLEVPQVCKPNKDGYKAQSGMAFQMGHRRGQVWEDVQILFRLLQSDGVGYLQ